MPSGRVLTTEVVVVGNGPAGAAACLALAQRGLTPLWVKPGDIAPPEVGETLSVAGVQLLQQLGAAGVLAHPDHRPENVLFSAWGSERLVERHAMRHPLGAGKVLHRRRFNHDLAMLAEPQARVVAARCVGFERDDEHWRLALADGTAVHARFLIDATGRRASLGRRLAPRRQLDTLMAVVSVLGPVSLAIEPTPATLVESVANGWWYATLLSHRRLAVMYFSDADLLPRQLRHTPASLQALLNGTRHVSRWLSDLALAPPAALALHACGSAWLEQPAGVGPGATAWAAIGDAALALDPLSSHGLSSALWSAERVAEGAVAWLAGESQGLQRYVEAVVAGRENYLRERHAMYATEGRFAQQPFWQRRAAVFEG